MQNVDLTNIRRYITFTYLGFWGLVALVATAFVASGLNMSVFQWGVTVASWTPTIVVLLLFKRLFPNRTVKSWIKEAFAARIHVGPLLAATAALSATMAATVWLVAWRGSQPILSLLNLSLPTLLTGLFFQLIQGAMGEEAGWRGYLQPLMEKRAGGVIKGSLLVGLVWSFWHTPVWFTRGLPGWQLAVYIACFIIGNTALSVIIGVSYHRSRNLAVPMWIHFVSNAIGVPYAGGLFDATLGLTAGYLLTAVGFSIWHLRTAKRVASQTFGEAVH